MTSYEPPLRKPSNTPSPANLQPATDAMDEGIAALRRSPVLKTAWPRMQHLCPPRYERLWVIGGQPGNYKTQFMWNLAMDMATLRQRVLFVSLEQTTGETALQAVARFGRIPLRVMEKAQGEWTEQQQRGLEVAAMKLAETEIYLRMHSADKHGRKIKDVIASATRARFDAVFVDHVGMIGRDEGRELEQLSIAIDYLRRLARGSIVEGYRPFVCCTSPLKRDAAAGDDELLPAITDFRGSSRLEYDADVAMILRKRKALRTDDSDEPDIVDAFVLKNRQGRCPLVLSFLAQGSICTVTERAPEDRPPVQHWQEGGDE
jgi:replicative DNA helicase